MAQMVMKKPKKILADFYRTQSVNAPVQDWILGLDKADRQVIGKDMQKVEFGWPIGMPYCRALSGGLHEVRSNISDGRIARVIFFVRAGRMVLLHGFIKKQQKTPQADLDLAERRRKEVARYDQKKT
jgi:phage-related protein